MADRYFLCTEVIYDSLMEETQSLFERYPEDDGIMLFAPDIRIKRQQEQIEELGAEIKRLSGFARRLLHMQKDLPAEHRHIVDKHFWDMLA